MRHLFKITLFVIATASIGMHSFAQDEMMMFKAKSGILEYKLSGKTTGTETVYFDNHGRREARFTESTTTILGMTTTEKTLNIKLDSVVYSIDLKEKTGTRTVMPWDPSTMTEAEWKEWEEWGKNTMQDMGFKKTGEEKILGHNCDIWEGLGSKIWMWENMALKTEVNMMGQWLIEATKIDFNTRISQDKFKVPKDIKIVSYDHEYEAAEHEVQDDDIDTLASDLEKELEKGLNDLRGILGVKKKKK
jgi:hypothetical protein